MDDQSVLQVGRPEIVQRRDLTHSFLIAKTAFSPFFFTNSQVCQFLGPKRDCYIKFPSCSI